MALSSIDIRRQEFKKKFFRGVDEREVKDYLDAMAREVDILQDKLRSSFEQVERLKSDLEHYQKVEEALQEALVTARENARKTQANAERKAEIIIKEAEMKSKRISQLSEIQGQKILQEAEMLSVRARHEVSRLLQKRSELIMRLRAFLSSEISLLDRIEKNEMDALLAFVGKDADALFENAEASKELQPKEEAQEKFPVDMNPDIEEDFEEIEQMISQPIEEQEDNLAIEDVHEAIAEEAFLDEFPSFSESEEEIFDEPVLEVKQEKQSSQEESSPLPITHKIEKRIIPPTPDNFDRIRESSNDGPAHIPKPDIISKGNQELSTTKGITTVPPLPVMKEVKKEESKDDAGKNYERMSEVEKIQRILEELQ